MTNPDNGFIYIFHGERFTKEAIISIESLRNEHKNAHVTAFCDDDNLPKGVFDNVVKIVPTSIRSKVAYLRETPYRRTIFLDTDTVLFRPVDDIFEMLERYDFCLTHDLARKRLKYSKMMPEYEEIPYAFSELNTGVIGFRKSCAVDECLAQWNYYYSKYYKKLIRKVPYDQPSFRIALWRSAASLYVLPPEYNIRSQANREKQIKFKREMGEEHLAERIIHMHHNQESLKDAKRYCQENAQPY